MQSNDGEPVQIVPADLGNPAQAAGLLACLEAYARDPMGGGVPLPGDVSARLIAGLKTAPYRIWLAETAGKIVGAAVCFDSYSTFRAQPRLNLHDLVVQPAWRRRGIGRQLLLAVIEHAQLQGCCAVSLEVRLDNPAAQALYRSVGFADCASPMAFWLRPV